MNTQTIQKTVAAILASAIITVVPSGFAASSTTQTVTYSVSEINEISVSGNPGALTVSTATAGSAPTSASDSSTSYAVTTNETSRKITGAINSAMPAGTTLTIQLAAPTGATSAGTVTLGTSAADLVTGIATLNESGKTITYTFSATAAAGVISSATKTVTLTVTAG